MAASSHGSVEVAGALDTVILVHGTGASQENLASPKWWQTGSVCDARTSRRATTAYTGQRSSRKAESQNIHSSWVARV